MASWHWKFWSFSSNQSIFWIPLSANWAYQTRRAPIRQFHHRRRRALETIRVVRRMWVWKASTFSESFTMQSYANSGPVLIMSKTWMGFRIRRNFFMMRWPWLSPDFELIRTIRGEPPGESPPAKVTSSDDEGIRTRRRRRFKGQIIMMTWPQLIEGMRRIPGRQSSTVNSSIQ